MPYSYDPVVAALVRVVDVMWPQVFAAVASTGPMADVEPIAHLFRERQQNPDYAYAALAISRDPRLAALLGPNGAGTFIRFDDGFGFRIQEATQVPEELVRAAARIAVAQDAADTTRSLIDTLRCLLPDVRRLVAGESVDVRVITAFEGIGVESGRAVHTPWGIMRAPSPFELRLHPFGEEEMPSAILETTAPIRMRLGEECNDGFMASGRIHNIQNDIDPLRLAVNLAFGRGTPVRWLWQTTLAPLVGMGRFRGPPPVARLGPGPPRDPMTNEEAIELHAWADRVAKRNDAALAVATRRTLSAMSERTFSAEDALIDAVIAWENLVGHGAPAEMTFRVTSALAILLEPDAHKRPPLRRELSKIYTLRSKVAHGSVVSVDDKLAEMRDRAIDVAIEAFRVLFHSHPSLISDRDRGMKLILGMTSASSEDQATDSARRQQG
jgi:Apea-like HEPN